MHTAHARQVDKAVSAKYSRAMTIAKPAADEPSAVPPGAGAGAEAARYALLRRLAPSMRHHLVVNLQPIGMIYEVMERRLRAPEPNLAQIHDSAVKINGFARAALGSCLDVVTWLAPDERATVEVVEAVRECVGLLATSLSFRGHAIRNEVTEVQGHVSRHAIRNVLTAALIHVTDQQPSPADLVLTAHAGTAGLQITLVLKPTDGAQGFATEAAYRDIEWADVQALAAAEAVHLDRDAQSLHMLVPWAPAQQPS
jgi:hypothetical protein